MMKRASALRIALIGHFDDARPAVPAGAGCRAAHRAGSTFRLARFAAAVFLTAVLTGCGAGRQDLSSLPEPPVILRPPDCPAPARPALARIDGTLPFDAPANVAAFLERDDVLRLHVRALEETIACRNARSDAPRDLGRQEE
jgi:hypothetical protein